MKGVLSRGQREGLLGLPPIVKPVKEGQSLIIFIFVKEGFDHITPLNQFTGQIIKREFHIFKGYQIDRNVVFDKFHHRKEFIEAFPFMHPIYHFQHGGRHTWNTGLSYGAALILESPRFAHPPMDAILGVDFVLTNFFVSSVLEFRAEGDYRNILRASHARVWRPYVQALAFAWKHISNRSAWPFTEHWPQLMS